MYFLLLLIVACVPSALSPLPLSLQFLFPFTLQNEVRGMRSASSLASSTSSSSFAPRGYGIADRLTGPESLGSATATRGGDASDRLSRLDRKVLNRGCVTPYDPTTVNVDTARGRSGNRRQSLIPMMRPEQSNLNRRTSIDEQRQMLQAELKIEMSQEFIPRDEDFMIHHRSFWDAIIEWKKQQPKSTIRTSLRHELMNFTHKEISSEVAVAFFKNLVLFFYEYHISPPEVPDFCEIQARQTLELQEVFYQIRSQCQAFRDGGLSFTMPILLLSLRIFVKKMFIAGFPLWSATDEGISTMREMNEMITTHFDPHGYFSSLSILESTSSAVKIMRQHPHRAHRALTKHFNDTSPLIRSLVVSPQCRETRIILNANSQKLYGSIRGARGGKGIGRSLRPPMHDSPHHHQHSGSVYGLDGGFDSSSVRSGRPSKPLLRPSEIDLDDYSALLKIHKTTTKGAVQQQVLNQHRKDERSGWLHRAY